MRRFGRLVLAIVSVGLLGVGGLFGQVAYAPRNIDWGAVAESDVVREVRAPRPGGLLSSGTEEVIEKRTLTLPSGNKLRITERIEVDAQGEEARVFVEGKQLGEVTVVATPETLDAVLALLRERGYVVAARYGRGGRILRVRVPAAEQSEACSLLGEVADLGVESVAHEQVRFFLPQAITPAVSPNDPRYGEQWGLRQIHAPEVWGKGFFGYPNVPCAVYDTGVHLTHEDLQENVRERISVLNSSPDPEDHHGHGSHCLGIMGADANNGRGIVGVGQVANLTSLRGPISYWQEGDDIRAGYQYALDNGIKVLSCSFGTSPGVGVFDKGDYALIRDLGDAGTLLVIAAGNDGNDNDRLPTFPSSYDCENILTVIASDKADRPVIAGNEEAGEGAHVWSTSYGATSCDIAAPGANILSCTRDGDGSYEKWSGTSMATPMVAACAAMLWEQNPSWSPVEIKRRLMETADVNSALLGYCQSGGRVNLERALDRSAGYLSIEQLASTAITAGTPITLTVRTENVEAFTFTLLKRDDSSFSETLATGGASGDYTVWTPGESDVGRGYYIRVSSDAAPDQVFAYSSVFRVKSAEKTETIEVSVVGNQMSLAADNFTVSFKPSDAVMADVVLDEKLANGSWEIAATLGQMSCTPGETKYATMQLKGRGWVQGTYRVRVIDTDAPEIAGVSGEIAFSTSTCAVYLLAGDPGNAPEDYKENGANYRKQWATEYRAGEPLRLNCYLPESSLYWLYLVDQTANEVYLLKQAWTDVSTGTMKRMQRFDLAFPDQFADGHTYWLRLYDAFAPEMYHDSPMFTISARADGRTAPSLDAIIGVPEGTGFYANGQWYPMWYEGAWALRCGWLSPGGEAYFETVITTTKAQTLSFDLHFPNKLSGTENKEDENRTRIGYGLSVAYTDQYPTNTSTWTTICNKSGGYSEDWATIETDELLPAGTHTLRWTFKRDPNATVSADEEEAFSLLIRKLTFNQASSPISVAFDGGCFSLNGEGVATLSGRGEYPEFVTYTVDGSEPTMNSPRWVSSQRLSFSDSTTLKVKSFLPGATPSATATAVFLKVEGSGTEAVPYQLTSGADLLALLSTVNLGTLYPETNYFQQVQTFEGMAFRLMRDLDLTGLTLPTAGFPAIGIGNADYACFNGLLEGGNHFLRNATIVPTHSPVYEDGVGQVCALFGTLGSFGVVQNLTLLDATYTIPGGDLYALAALVGTLDGSIANCHVARVTFDAPTFFPDASKDHHFTNPLYARRSDASNPDFKGSSAFGCTLNGKAVDNIDGWDSKFLATPFLAPPILTPVPGPIFATTEVTLAAPAGAKVQQWDGKAWSDAPTSLSLSATKTLVLRTTDGTNISAEMVATYDFQNKPSCPRVGIIVPVTGDSPIRPFSVSAELVANSSDKSAGGWTIRYTLDGTDPTETSPRYDGAFLLPGECTVKAQIFNAPHYSPGEIGTWNFSVSPEHPYCAQLHVIGGKLQGKTVFTDSLEAFDQLPLEAQRAILYQSQAFEVKANEPPAGMYFSHWKVTGPLVLEDATADPLTTRYMTSEAVTLEAVFLPKRPGYRLWLW